MEAHEDLIVPADDGDWERFLVWAAGEGWRIPQLEISLLLDGRLGRVLALRRGGICCGFVSFVVHEHSGWIGNLMVAPEFRGHGIGAKLFEECLRQLGVSGVERVWLTASEQGRPLYERRGFVTLGVVRRWVRPAGAIDSLLMKESGNGNPFDNDAFVWGEKRTALLELLGEHGIWCSHGGSTALLQHGHDLQIIGPWHRGADTQEGGAALLQQLLAVADPRREVVCDLLADAAEEACLAATGFRTTGSNLLMVRGGSGDARLERLVALATLGSGG